MPSRQILSALAALSLLAPADVSAQAAPAQQSAPVIGCRGYSFSSTTDDLTGLPLVYPVITAVQPGSPAERAGIQPGDSLVAINGIETPAWDPERDRVRAPGDTVRLRVRRGTVDRELRVVLGARDAPTVPGEPGRCRPVAAAIPPR